MEIEMDAVLGVNSILPDRVCATDLFETSGRPSGGHDCRERVGFHRDYECPDVSQNPGFATLLAAALI
jgi:hypothetical protein